MMRGVCYVKEGFRVIEDRLPGSKEPIGTAEPQKIEHTNDEVANETNNGEPNAKRPKLSKKERRLKKGQNKSRPPPHKERRENNLCKNYYHGPTENKCAYERCSFMHDIDKYLSVKADDIGPKCHIYSTKGFCSWGLTCRFAKSHIDENNKNVKMEGYVGNLEADTFNQISYDLQVLLRKRKYDLSKSKEILKKVGRLRKKDDDQTVDNCCDTSNNNAAIKVKTDDCNDEEPPKPTGFVPDHDVIKLRRREKKQIDFSNKLLLSPLTTVGNLPFRRICKEFGADITCGEMACAVPIINGSMQEWALAKRHKSEDIFGVQLCGNNSELLTYAAQVLNENCDIDFIDLNLGCPIDLIFQQGGGSALIRRPNVLESIIRSCSSVLGDIPFTVKTRTGVYKDKNVAHELVPKFEEWGAKAVTVHGRSREQRYMKRADWQYIEECAQKLQSIPMIGNGDILSLDDYMETKTVAPHVSSVMLGRGPLIKPWVFKEIKEGKPWDPSSRERFDMLQKYVNYGLEHWGADTKGVENTRRFLLEWQSFLYRYVPHGILESPPQKINERPIRYHGRDELETLMASESCSDWIKISEMLLGPVPDGYKFLPKHKANSYQVE